MLRRFLTLLFFFFNDTATTEIYTLSLHDALPISLAFALVGRFHEGQKFDGLLRRHRDNAGPEELDHFGDQRMVTVVRRSEEHTSELQSQSNLVCRLLLEKKKYRIQNKSSSLLR